MSLTPTQLSELQTIVESLSIEFPSSDDSLWEAAIRIQKGGLGPVTGPGGQPAFDAAVADIVIEAEQIATIQARQGGPGNSFNQATFNVVPVEDNLPAGALGDVIYVSALPNTYLSTDVVNLTPAGPNSVILSEIGTQVARTVAAASGGMEVNNLSTGAGFERVLTASDLGGGVNSVTGGTNINLTGTAVDPIVNLDAAITGVTVNGVNLTTAGVATNFLDETGNYSVPAGGSPGGADTNVQFNNLGAFGGSGDFTWDNTNGILTLNQIGASTESIRINNIDPSAPVIVMGGVGSASTNWDIFRSIDNGGSAYWFMKDDHSLSSPNHRLELQHSTLASAHWRMEAGGDGYMFGETAARSISVVNVTVNPTDIRVGDQVTFRFDEKAAAGTPVANFGELWVRNDTPNNLIFTDDAGTDFVIGGALAPTGAQISGTPANNQIAIWTNATTIEGDANLLWDGVDFDIVGAGGLVITNGAGAVAVRHSGTDVNWTHASTTNWNITGITAIQAGTVDLDVDAITATSYGGILEANLLDASATETVSGAWTFTNVGGLNLGASCELDLRNNADTGTTFIQNLGPTLQFGISGADFGAGIFEVATTSWAKMVTPPIFIEEQAAAEADVAGDGQVWVRNDTPNTLMFTDDAGTDFVVSGAAAPVGVANPMTADLDGDGFDLDDMGVLFMREQAAADADVTGQGQLWVRTDTFSNTLMFTNDNGNDFEVAGLPDSDESTGAVLIAGTSFVAAVNVAPKVNTSYMFIAHVEVTAPAADDMNIQMTMDTNTRIYATVTNSNDNATSVMEGQVGEVVTNNVLIPTDGTATPNGTYVQIMGRMVVGATSGTHSIRFAKNADTGADGFAVRCMIKLFTMI